MVYLDILLLLDLAQRYLSVMYTFFFKNLVIVYTFLFIYVFTPNFYLFFITNLFVDSYFRVDILMGVDFSYIQILHIILKVFKIYVFFALCGVISKSFKFFSASGKNIFFVNYYLFFLYLLTGSYWAWLEPSWVSWWFGEDIEELFILILFLHYINMLHSNNKLYILSNTMFLIILFLLLTYISNYFMFISRHKNLTYYTNNFYFLFYCLFLFSFKYFSGTKVYFYIFNLSDFYNFMYWYILKLSYKNSFNKFIYIFEFFYLGVFILYELPIVLKITHYFFNTFTLLYMDVFTLDCLYFSVFWLVESLITLKLNLFILFFIFDWNSIFYSFVVLNNKLVLILHYFYFYYLVFQYSFFNLYNVNYYKSCVKAVLINFNYYIQFLYFSNLNFIKYNSDQTILLINDYMYNIYDMSKINKFDLLYNLSIFLFFIFLTNNLI